MKEHSLYLAFPIEDGKKLHVFHLVKDTVQVDSMIDISTPDEPTCGCTMFVFGKTCPHILTAGPAQHIVKGTWVATPDIDQWWDAANIGIYDVHTKNFGVVPSTELADISIDAFLSALKDEKDISDTTGDALNIERWYGEALKSCSTHKKMNSKVVKDAGVDAAKGVSSKKKSSKPKTPAKPKDVPAWRKVAKPPESQFYVETETWEALQWCFATGNNVLLTGPAGCGKSEIVQLAAQAAAFKYEPFNMGAMSEPRLSLIGATHFDKGKGTWFSESRFVRTIKDEKNEGAVVLMDELTRADRGAFNILLPLLDRQRYLALDEAEDAAIIRRGKKVAIAATANIGMEYTGTDVMDKALKERFKATIDLGWPPASVEHGLLVNRHGIDSATAKRLVAVAQKQRELQQNDEFTEGISIRMLLAAAEMIGDGHEYETAMLFAIANTFSPDGGEESDRTKVRQIIQKMRR